MAKAEKAEKVSKPKAEKKEKTARQPSAYNLFMKEELPKIKKAQPTLSHKEAFKVAASGWKTSPQNPANGK